MKKFLLILALLSKICVAETLAGKPYEVCFVPGQDCAQVVVDAINGSKNTVDVQAYHLTNKKIIAALEAAKSRGIMVRIIVDKAGVKRVIPILTYNIPIWVDYKNAIAHNKVVIIDDQSFITGSFNFTDAAQKRNVENLIWIKDPAGAVKYEGNFLSRLAVSRVLVLDLPLLSTQKQHND